MNGAEALIATLVRNGVELCLANPGTSEMQLVAAVDKVPGMRPVLALYEPSVLSVDSWEPLSDTYAQLIAPEGKAVSDIEVSVAMQALAHMLAHPLSKQRLFLN